METFINLPGVGDPAWKSPVSTAGALPLTGNVIGDARAAEDTGVVWVWNGSAWLNGSGGGGTVTSVGLADSTNTFNITGSPVTGVGTLTLSGFKSQSANTFLAAPNGSSGAPSFRLIVPADVPTLNQNTTGTAGNITATSNSTITTLSALSLPGAQVTGNISGNAGNITATSNSTLTTLSALSLPATQLTGTLQAAQFPALSGDVTTTAGSLATTLATVNSNVGTFGSSVAIPTITVNAKGLVTAATINSVIAPAGTLSGNTLAAGVVNSSLTSVGILTSGTWNAGTIGIPYGGTGLNTAPTNGQLLIGSTAGSDYVLNTLTAGTGISIVNASGSITITNTSPSSGGTVTNVTASAPLQSSGGNTPNISFPTETANTVLAGPTSGGAATPTFRGLVSADIPNNAANTTGTASNITGTSNSTLTTLSALSLPTSQLTGTISLTTQVSGVLPIANGGTNNSSAYTAGSVIFSNGTSLTQDNAALFWDDTNKTLGIGQTPQAASVITTLNTSGAAKPIWTFSYGTGSTTGVRGDMARGTVGTPTATQTGDTLNFMSGRGYGTSQFATTSTGVVQIIAGENFTNTSNLTYISLKATPTGSVTNAEAARVASTGVTLGPQSASTAVHAVNGGMTVTTRTITANLTLDTTTTDYLILCNQSGAITITFPAPVAGRMFVIKDISGTASTNNITIARFASEQIEGVAASKILQTNFGSWTFVTDGTNWWEI